MRRIPDGKWVALLTVMVAACAARATSYRPEWDVLSTAICVERIENHGCMNTHPSRITVSLAHPSNPLYEAILTGGEAICFFLAPDVYSVSVSAKKACYPDPTDPEDCLSIPYSVDLTRAHLVQLNVWPKADEQSYMCGWELLPRGVPQPGNCLQP